MVRSVLSVAKNDEKSVCVLFPKMSEYVRNFNCAKTEYFLIKEEEVKNIIKSEQKLKYFKVIQ